MSTQFTFKAADGTELNGHHWPAAHEAVCNIVIVHGYGHHGGSFDEVAARFNKEDYGVYAIDQRGHGRSPGKSGYIATFNDWVDDTHAFITHINPDIKSLPLFFIGHSLGCLALGLYVVQYAPTIHGLIFSSGLLRIPDHVPAYLQKLATVLSALTPTLPVQKVDVEATSRDPKAVQALRDDPLRYGGMMHARSGAEVAKAIATFQEKMGEITAPILIMHGTQDKLTDCEGSRLLNAKVKSQDKTLCIYEGGYHELYNDIDKERWYTQVLEWLRAHR